jgi:outer membrane biosynthesis protein TonB
MSLESEIKDLKEAILAANVINREALELRKQMLTNGVTPAPAKTPLEVVKDTPLPVAEKPAKAKAAKKETPAPEPTPEPQAEPEKEEAPAADEPEVEVTLEMVRELVRPLLAACQNEAEKAAVNAKTGAALAEFGKTKFTELDPSDRAAFYKRMKEVHS